MSSFFTRHKKGIFITLGLIGLIGVLGIAILFFGFFSSANRVANTVTRTHGTAEYDRAQEAVTTADDASGEDGSVTQATDRKVIRNGNLSLVVGDIDESAERVTEIANSAGGFLEYSSISDRGTDRTKGNLRVRVPSDSFDRVFSELKKIAIQVRNEQTDARDVTDQFVDLEARLRNAQRTEEQYLEILEQATTVEDTLKVQRRLSEVREEIERLEARMNQLSRQIDMATISVTLIAEGDVEIMGVVWSPLNQVKQGVNNMIEGVIGFVNRLIKFVFALPVILLWIALIAGIIAGVWKGGVWAKRKFFNKKEEYKEEI